jgi:hypothetical protein
MSSCSDLIAQRCTTRAIVLLKHESTRNVNKLIERFSDHGRHFRVSVERFDMLWALEDLKEALERVRRLEELHTGFR